MNSPKSVPENWRKGIRNRATLAVARKMVCYLLAVDRRKQDFVPAEKFSRRQRLKSLS